LSHHPSTPLIAGFVRAIGGVSLCRRAVVLTGMMMLAAADAMDATGTLETAHRA
jgi:hypothetical protein